MNMLRLSIMAGLCLLLCSCQQETKPEGADATSPVTGEVYVDGSPAEGLRVICHGADPDQQFPTVSLAVTDAEGKFAFATYTEGDGLREGEYVLTFDWRDGYAMVSGTPSGPDKLDNRYNAPGKSTTRLTVTAETPVDLGRIELTTK
ncbi:MAG: DUF4198 domain-containing protein [Rhodopirellula sp.]|nr:DUF4198 domain-containing protein [Rhodopirellula sp.]